MDFQFHYLLFCIVLASSLILRWATGPKNLPPGPTGLPVIGNLHQLGRMPHVSFSLMESLHKPNTVISLRLGSVTTVVVSSPDLAREVLLKNDQSFANRPVPDAVASQPHVEGTLAWVPGDRRWRSRRRFCTTHLFAASSHHLRQQNLRHLLDHVRDCATAAQPVNVGEVAFATVLNLLSTDVVEAGGLETAGELKEQVRRIMEMSGKPNVSNYFPAIKRLDLQGIRRGARESYLWLHQIIDVLIEKRLEERASSGAAGRAAADFLDLLLHQTQADGSDFPSQAIKPLILELFIGGSDSSALTIEWVMAELLRKPEAMQKLRNELREAIRANGEVKESDIIRLSYLQAVIKETLRLHPAAPLLLPYVKGDDTVVGGYTVPKGTQVIINAWSIGRAHQYWEEPLSFTPERFLGSDLDYKGRDFRYLPFGAGRRSCPGMRLAERTVALTLASIIHAFDWKLPEGTTPESLDMTEQFGVTLRKSVSLFAVPMIDV